MDHSLPVVSRRPWKLVGAVIFMLRKGISKSKLMLHLSTMIKRGKIAGKALGKLMFHHHHHHHHHQQQQPFSAPREYEFSCSNSPAFPFHLNTRHRHRFFTCAQAPSSADLSDLTMLNTLTAVLQKLGTEEVVSPSSALLGFGQSPAVRQLRVTDSPFPVADMEADCQVDKAAEEFIDRFYKELKQQK